MGRSPQVDRQAAKDRMAIALQQRRRRDSALAGAVAETVNVARAVRGLTIPRRDAQTMLEGLNRLDRDVLAKKWDLLAIRFGFNDMTRISEEPFRKNLEAEKFAAIVARGREAKVKVVLPPNGEFPW